MKDQGSQSLERVEDRVREHPARSVLTAFGVGLVLSSLIRGR